MILAVKNIKAFVVLFLVVLMIMNYKVLFFALENDFIGVLLSMILFFIGGRVTRFKVHYLLVVFLILFEFVSYRLHTKSLHFLSLSIMVCLVYYSFTKKFSFIAFISLMLFSSLFNKFFEHLSAEIKQALCQGVYVVLKNSISIEKIEGVNFYINGAKITIDTACMGLSMFKTGFLAAAALFTIEERKQKGYFSIIQIVFFCFVVILLNVISNFFRIITLVLLDCTQENLLHHSVGLICFLLYQMVPMLLLMRYMKPNDKEVQQLDDKINWFPVLVAFVVVFCTSIEMYKNQKFNLLENMSFEYNSKTGEWVNDEVFKISEPKKLIYIKTPSHKPMICWTGDGYKILESKIILLHDSKVWFNKMEKDNKYYNSYWWYECGGKKYTSFLEVMFQKLIYNDMVRLVNVVKEE
jgi:exosortase N